MKLLQLIIILIISKNVFSQNQYGYDNTNRLIQVNNGNCAGIKYSYDSNGNRTFQYAYNITTRDSLVNETCPNANDGSVALISSGNFSYKWSNGQTNSTINNLSPGNYTVVIKDNPSGSTCSKSFTIKPQFVDSFTVQPQNTSCFQSANGSASTQILIPDTRSSYSYKWSNSNDTAYYSVTNTSNLAIGDYVVSIRNSFTGCIKTIPFTISQPAPIIKSIQSSNNTCFGKNSATASVDVIGSPSQYIYTWTSNTFSQSQTTQQIDSLDNGIYYVNVTENFGNGCTMNDTVPISGPIQSNLIGVTTDSTSTLGSNDGSATAQVLGDSLNYTYQWYNNTTNTYINQNAATVTGLHSGNYLLTITSKTTDSCKSSKAFSIAARNTSLLYSLFPNPTNGFVYITVYTQSNADVAYTVFTSSGQAIITGNINASNGQVIKINLSQYSDGIYFIQLISNNQKTTLRVVKQP